MKILIVTPFYPPDLGGIAHHVFNIAKILSKKHEVIIAKNDNMNGVTFDGEIKLIRIFSKSLPPYPYQTLSSFRIPILFRELKKMLNDEKLDVVHLHGHHYPITWLSTYYAKKYGRPTILTLHGMYALNPSVFGGYTLLEEAFNKAIFKTLLRRTNVIISLSKSIMDYAMKYEPNKVKYRIIPNGVDLNSYNKNLYKKVDYRVKYSLPLDKVIILFLGRFSYAKGALEAAYAAKQIVKTKPDTFFLFVGDGPLSNVIKGLLSETENVKVLDWIPAETVHELYIASDIFLLPSRWEALPITLLEAMASRLFIISTKVGGVLDIVNKYPRKELIESPEPNLISRALDKVLNNLDMNVDGVGEYMEQFDWNNIVHKLEKLYKFMKAAAFK